MSDQTAADTADEDYQSQTTIAASTDVVFEALTTLDGLSAWWTAVTGDGSVGGELTFSFGPDAFVVMRVDEAKSVVRIRWSVLACHFDDWLGTTVHFDLEPLADDRTELRFRHGGLTPKLECFEDCKSGWDHFIPSLRAYAETGVGHPNQSPADLARRDARGQQRASVTVR